jgi:MbtH protein
MNPFENEQGSYLVLVNARAQRSLWPAHLDRPAGWTVEHGTDSRAGCLAHIEANWTDLRPATPHAPVTEECP